MKYAIRNTLLPLIFISINTYASYDIGIKAGYQVYDNNLDSPSALGGGVFVSLPLFDSLNLEGGFTFLGEAKASNGNQGGFYVGELSLMAPYSLSEHQQLFAKLGAAPWVGYTSFYQGDKRYEVGMAPVGGIGYQWQWTDAIKGRIEYQYFYDLGDEVLGHTDGHFVSLGLLWGPDTTQAESYSNVGESRPTPQEVELTTQVIPITLTHYRYLLEGAFLFARNSSELDVSHATQSFTTLTELTDRDECLITSVIIDGYADAVGTPEHNLALSQSRALAVEQFFQSQFKVEQADTNWYGQARLSQSLPEMALAHERRANFQIEVACEEAP